MIKIPEFIYDCLIGYPQKIDFNKIDTNEKLYNYLGEQTQFTIDEVQDDPSIIDDWLSNYIEKHSILVVDELELYSNIYDQVISNQVVFFFDNALYAITYDQYADEQRLITSLPRKVIRKVVESIIYVDQTNEINTNND